VANIPITDAVGATVNVATSSVTRDGVTENLELITLADPITATQVSVTAPGTTGINAVSVQGVTGGVPLPVVSSVNGSSSAAITSTTVGTTSTTLLVANLARLGSIYFNAGPSVAYLSYGSVNDASTNFSFTVPVGGYPYIDSIPWRGIVTAITQSGSAQLQVTELS
jgi:hypothetical protein